jgi:tetratricopeptide (TPR) repeat protein
MLPTSITVAADPSRWKDADARSTEGAKLVARGRVNEARKLFEEAVVLNPSKSDLWINLGTAQKRLGMLSEAVDSFYRGLALNPKDAVLLEGIQELEGLLASDLDEVEISGDSIKKISGNGPSNVDLASSLTNEAIELAEAGKMRRALELFQQAVEKDPLNGRSWMNLGVTYLRMEMVKEARVALERAGETVPANDVGYRDNIEALESNANIRDTTESDDTDDGDDGDTDEGDDDEESARKNAARITEDAIALAESGDAVGSLGLFEEATKQDPENSQYFQNLAVTQMRVGLLFSARESFNKAKTLLLGAPSTSLKANIAALDEQFVSYLHICTLFIHLKKIILVKCRVHSLY